MIDATDRAIVNRLQGGFPVCRDPFAAAAAGLGISAAELIDRIRAMIEGGVLSRFGPLYNAERLGGELTLCAMRVPENDWQRVVEIVNRFDEVAHNYQRDHALNMWFVIATDRPNRAMKVIEAIEAESGLSVLDMPKEEEIFVGLRLSA